MPKETRDKSFKLVVPYNSLGAMSLNQTPAVPTVRPVRPVSGAVFGFSAPAPTVPVEEPKTKTTVTRIQISGKQYLKSSVNILYDPDTKEEVGLWNPITKKIEELPEDEDEEEEEEDEYE